MEGGRDGAWKVYNLSPNVKAANFWLKPEVVNLFYVESGTQDMLDHTKTNTEKQ